VWILKSQFEDSEPVAVPESFTLRRVKNLEDVGSQLVLALESAYNTIRQENPDVPPAVIVINSGGNVKYGHFARTRWDVHGHKVAEIMISAEGLKRPPRLVLATLIHEAAHGVAFTRGIDDTTKDGKYHNKKFKAVAEELGLQVDTYEGRPSIGHSNTTLPENEWEEVLTELEPKLVAYRDFDPQGPKKPMKPHRQSYQCRCPRTIQIRQGQYEQGPILCGVCGDEFE